MTSEKCEVNQTKENKTKIAILNTVARNLLSSLQRYYLIIASS